MLPLLLLLVEHFGSPAQPWCCRCLGWTSSLAPCHSSGIATLIFWLSTLAPMSSTAAAAATYLGRALLLPGSARLHLLFLLVEHFRSH